jgi:superfamily II DNA or RNA helicase
MVEYLMVPKEPDKAYVSNRLWLPKSRIREYQVKQALQFLVNAEGGQELLRLWDDSTHHVVCPREFLPPSQYPFYKFPFIDLRPQFGRVEFEDCVVPRDETQEKAWQVFAKNDNGILNLGCGKGKTKLAVKKIAQKKTPTLVIVPDGGIYTQWEEAIHGGAHSPVGLRFSGPTGNIRGGEFDWENCPVVLALMPSLALKIRDGKVPEEFFRYFGLIIYDEVHITGAPVFSLTAAPFYGDRIGLTATVQREDGLDPIYRYHLGEPFYTDLTQDLIPHIYFWRTPAQLDVKACIRGKTVNVSLLRTALGRDYAGNVYRYWAISQAVKEGRKILCLSHSKDQLKLFHALFPESGLILGATPQDERTHILRSHQITFAIAKLGSQGVDDPKLDTLFWLTPFRSKISLQQSMGRIQRAYEGKGQPIMVVFEDHLTGPLKGLCTKLRSNLYGWGFKVETHAPAQFPTTFPPEVSDGYAAAFAELPERLSVDA